MKWWHAFNVDQIQCARCRENGGGTRLGHHHLFGFRLRSHVESWPCLHFLRLAHPSQGRRAALLQAKQSLLSTTNCRRQPQVWRVCCRRASSSQPPLEAWGWPARIWFSDDLPAFQRDKRGMNEGVQVAGFGPPVLWMWVILSPGLSSILQQPLIKVRQGLLQPNSQNRKTKPLSKLCKIYLMLKGWI